MNTNELLSFDNISVIERDKRLADEQRLKNSLKGFLRLNQDLENMLCGLKLSMF